MKDYLAELVGGILAKQNKLFDVWSLTWFNVTFKDLVALMATYGSLEGQVKMIGLSEMFPLLCLTLLTFYWWEEDLFCFTDEKTISGRKCFSPENKMKEFRNIILQNVCCSQVRNNRDKSVWIRCRKNLRTKLNVFYFSCFTFGFTRQKDGKTWRNL